MRVAIDELMAEPAVAEYVETAQVLAQVYGDDERLGVIRPHPTGGAAMAPVDALKLCARAPVDAHVLALEDLMAMIERARASRSTWNVEASKYQEGFFSGARVGAGRRAPNQKTGGGRPAAKQVLEFAGARVGGKENVWLFGVGVARVFVETVEGRQLWQPADPPDGVKAGGAALTLPVPGGEHGAVTDIIAMHPSVPSLWWRRTGLAEWLGEAALDRARFMGEPVTLYANPLAWLRGWAVWKAEREAEIRAALPPGRTADRAAANLIGEAGEHGACALDPGNVDWEAALDGVPAVLCDDPDFAAETQERIKRDRKRRRAKEPKTRVYAREAQGSGIGDRESEGGVGAGRPAAAEESP